MDFADNSFDFVIARMVLEHLPNPLDAVKEVYRVLKTAEKGVFIENDFDMHLRAHPDIAELTELYEAYCRCRVSDGGNPRIGRKLPGLLLEAGFSNVDLEIVGAHNRVLGMGMAIYTAGLLPFSNPWSKPLVQIIVAIVIYVGLYELLCLMAFMEIWQTGRSQISLLRSSEAELLILRIVSRVS